MLYMSLDIKVDGVDHKVKLCTHNATNEAQLVKELEKFKTAAVAALKKEKKNG